MFASVTKLQAIDFTGFSALILHLYVNSAPSTVPLYVQVSALVLLKAINKITKENNKYFKPFINSSPISKKLLFKINQSNYNILFYKKKEFLLLISYFRVYNIIKL